MDLLANYSFDQVCRLVELRKHLCASDRHVMVDHIIHQLSIAHLFQVSYRLHSHITSYPLNPPSQTFLSTNLPIHSSQPTLSTHSHIQATPSQLTL